MVLVSLLFLLAFVQSSSAQQPGTDMAEFLKQHQKVPQVKQLIAETLEPMKFKVSSVFVEDGSSQPTRTETQKYIAGRIEKIDYNPGDATARVIAVREDLTIKQVSYWRLQDGVWQPYEPEHPRQVPQKNEQGTHNQAL